MKLIFVFLSTVCLLTGILFFVRSTEISYICSIPADSLKQKGVPTENNEFILGDTKYGSILENILKERGCSIRQTSRKSIVAVRGMKLHKFRAPRACINYTYSTLLFEPDLGEVVHFYYYDPFYRNVFVGRYPMENVFDEDERGH